MNWLRDPAVGREGARGVQAGDKVGRATSPRSRLPDTQPDGPGSRFKMQHICGECGQQFAEIRNLMKDMALHQGDQLFKCAECHRVLFAHDITTHECQVENSDTDVMPAPQSINMTVRFCSACFTYFLNAEDLTMHMLAHTNTAVKPFTCGLCDKHCEDLEALTSHMPQHTADEVVRAEYDSDGSMMIKLDTGMLKPLARSDRDESPEECSEITIGDTVSDDSRKQVRVISQDAMAWMSFYTSENPLESNNHEETLHIRATDTSTSSQNPCIRAGLTKGQANPKVAANNLLGMRSQDDWTVSGVPLPSRNDEEDAISITDDDSSIQEIEMAEDESNVISAAYDSSIEEVDMTGGTLYVCDHCGRTFDHELVLRRHDNFEHMPGRPYACNSKKCDFRARSASELEQHRLHSFICKKCGGEFKTQKSRNKHASMHSEARSMVCQFCNHEARSQHALGLHLLTHANEMVYTCKLCDDRFRSADECRRHEVSSHEPAKPHACRICGMRFTKRKSMAKHFEGQHGKDSTKQFVCVICQRSFVYESGMEQHMLHAHPSQAAPSRAHSHSQMDYRFDY